VLRSVRRLYHVTGKWKIVARKRTPTGNLSQFPYCTLFNFRKHDFTKQQLLYGDTKYAIASLAFDQERYF